MRDEFEAWVKNPHMLHRRTEPEQTDEYEHPWVEGAWSAWQVNHAVSESDFIIAVYRGFQSAIGIGETYLSCRDGLCRVDWDSPRLADGKRFSGRFDFDSGIREECVGGEEIGRRWAEKFRDQLHAVTTTAGSPPQRSDCRPDERDMI